MQQEKVSMVKLQQYIISCLYRACPKVFVNNFFRLLKHTLKSLGRQVIFFVRILLKLANLLISYLNSLVFQIVFGDFLEFLEVIKGTKQHKVIMFTQPTSWLVQSKCPLICLCLCDPPTSPHQCQQNARCLLQTCKKIS